jgi:GNAT superfamily N-acetyltransferase
MTGNEVRDADGVAFVDCAQGGVELTRRFYHEVMVPNFRPDELPAEDVLVTALTEGRDTVGMIATGPGGEPLGGFVAEWYGASRVLLLSYLAVPPQLRGLGLGTRLAQAAGSAWLQRFDPLLVLGEVEDPRFYEVDPNFGDAWARLRLYERLGGQALPLDYFQPALAPGRARVLHMLLLCFLVQPAALVAPGRLAGPIIEQFLRDYFGACEGGSPDPQLQGLLDACGETEGLALIAPSVRVASP